MNILVTGGTGYIGSHTAVELLNEGYGVILLDNFSNSKPEVINRIKRITGKDFRSYNIDLLDKKRLGKVFEENQLDAVIHFAGFKAVGESVANPIKYYQNNVVGTLVLCETMSRYSVKKLVFSSSATVYGTDNNSPLTEDMTLSTNNPYGSSKMIIEMILRDLYYSDREWRVSILRYFNPIGAHESGLIGEDPNGEPNNLMPYITQVAVGTRNKLTIFGNDYPTHDGTGIRDYIHVVDLAKGHIKALERVLVEPCIDVFNLGTGIGYSVLDLIRHFEESTGIKIPFVLSGRRPGDVAVCYANPEKAAKTLNWKAEKDIHDMCRDSWRWQSKNPDGYKLV
ncbi:MAG: UDP-glucose 4-epimerase [Clostridiales bacterium 38_11]|nr:MAG: UDP-glucose 4-epimerase [Clostridiales bacterium 38_11]